MMIRPRNSLSFRLTLWYVLFLTVLVATAGLFVYHRFEARLTTEVDESLRSVANEVWRDWRHTEGRTWADAVSRAADRNREHGVTVQVIKLDETGAPVVAETVQGGLASSRQLVLGKGVYARIEEVGDHGRYLTTSAPQVSPSPLRVGLFDLRGPYVLQIGIPLGETIARLRQLALLLVLGGALLLGFASLGGHFIIQRALRPVHDVVRAARAISADDLAHRIEGAGRRDEIGDLVATFNDMLGRLETSVGKIKQFTADVSHELRTPLTIIRAEIEVCLRRERTPEDYRETLDSVLVDIGRMGALIEDMLLLSRLDASKGTLATEAVALDEILLRVFEHRESLAQAKPLQFMVEEADPVTIQGDSRLLERLIANLVDNAIRFTPANGRVELALSQTEEGAVLRVRDTGIGIPSSSLPSIFERFNVGDPSRSRETGGMGLGLSIVKSIADLHAATVLVSSAPGQGSLFEVRFPIRGGQVPPSE